MRHRKQPSAGSSAPGSGRPKYKAKITEMHVNYAKGIQRFWGVMPHPWVVEAYQAGVTPEAADRLAANTAGKAALWLARTRMGVGTPQENGDAEERSQG